MTRVSCILAMNSLLAWRLKSEDSYLFIVFPGPVRSGFLPIFGWTATATGPLYIESVKRPDRTDKKPQKTGLNQLQPVFEKTGLINGCNRLFLDTHQCLLNWL